MTPAEWLAALVLASVAYNVVEGVVDPNAVQTTINNKVAAAIRVLFALAIIVAALVVLL